MAGHTKWRLVTAVNTNAFPAAQNANGKGVEKPCRTGSSENSRGRTRTYDKRINSPLLYRLSYAGISCSEQI